MFHFTGNWPNNFIMLFATDISKDPNINLNDMPATMTDVSEGINNTERKKFRPLIRRLFSMTAKVRGKGISIATVVKVKKVFVRIALKK